MLVELLHREQTRDRPSSDRQRLALCLIAVAAALSSICPVRSFDVPWVIAAGDEVLRTRSLPARDPFSYTAPGPWMHHEWMTEVVCSLLHRLGGWGALGALVGVMVAAVVLVVLGARDAGKKAIDLRWVAGALLLLGLRETADPVAQLFSNLFFAVLLRLLLDWDVARPGAPPSARLTMGVFALGVAWTQLHGGNPTGAALLGAWLLASPSTGRALLFAAGALATCAGPYGFLVHTHFFAHREAFAAVREFQPLSSALAAGSALHFAFLAYVLAAALALAVRARRGERIGFLAIALAGFFCVTLLHVRIATETAIVATFVIAPALVRIPSRPLPSMAIAVAILVAGVLLSARRPGLGLDRERFPVETVEFLRRARPPGPLFNSYNFGGYLLYAYPAERVFIDGRAFTVYSDDQMRTLPAIYDDPERFSELQHRYGFRLAVLQRRGRGATLLEWMKSGGRWRTVHEDPVAVVLVSTSPDR